MEKVASREVADDIVEAANEGKLPWILGTLTLGPSMPRPGAIRSGTFSSSYWCWINSSPPSRTRCATDRPQCAVPAISGGACARNARGAEDRSTLPVPGAYVPDRTASTVALPKSARVQEIRLLTAPADLADRIQPTRGAATGGNRGSLVQADSFQRRPGQNRDTLGTKEYPLGDVTIAPLRRPRRRMPFRPRIPSARNWHPRAGRSLPERLSHRC